MGDIDPAKKNKRTEADLLDAVVINIDNSVTGVEMASRSYQRPL